MDLDAAFVRFGELYPTPAAHPLGGGKDWEGYCGAFCFRFGLFTSAPFRTSGDISSAWAVALNSGILDPDPSTAGPGSQHFWRQKGVRSGRPGHVATELLGHRLAMASAYCDTYLPGTVHLGYSTVASYSARRSKVVEYMGHARNYAGAVVNAAGTASSGGHPINSSTDEGRHEMKWVVVKNSDGATFTGILYGELTKQTFRYDPAQPTSSGTTAFLAAEAIYAERSLDRQYITDAQSLLEDANLAARVKQFQALIPISGGSVDLSHVATSAQVAAVDEKVSALHFPTKIESTLS